MIPAAPHGPCSAVQGPGHGGLTTGTLWQLAALLPALGLSLAVFLVPVPPFPDVPFHVAAAVIRADFGGVDAFPVYYSLFDGFGPNSLFHALAASSGHPLVATPVMITFATFGSALVLLALARRFRTGPVFPLVAGMFAINYSVAYGFLEFVIGTPLLLVLVWLLGSEPGSRSGESGLRKTPWGVWGAALAALLCLIFYAHAILCIFALCVLGVYVLLVWRRSRACSFVAALAALPSLAAIAYWKLSRQGDPGGFGWLVHYYRNSFLADMPNRFRDLVAADHGRLVSEAAGVAIGLAIVGLAAFSVILACVRGGRRPAVLGDAKPASAGAVSAVQAFAMASFGVVLFGPPGLPPFWSIYQRFVFAMWIAVALWACVGAARRFAPRVLVYSLVVANAVLGALWFEHVYRFGVSARDLIDVAREASPDGLGAYVVADTSP